MADHALRSRDYVNVMVAGKQPCFDWLTMDQARVHCARGAGVGDWAGTENGAREPDAVLARAGDVPTQEVLAAAQLLRRTLPEVAVRAAAVRRRMQDARLRHHDWIRVHGTDLPEVAERAWDA